VKLDVFFGLASALVAGGIALVAYQVFAIVADLVIGGTGLLRRRFRPVVIRSLADLQVKAGVIEQQSDASLSVKAILSSLITRRYFWGLTGVLAAVAVSDVLLSPTVLVIIVVAGELWRSQHQQKRLQVLHRDAGELISQFASRYPLVRSVGKALSETADSLPDGEVRRAVHLVVQRLRVNQTIPEAVKAFQVLPLASLQQFGAIIVNAQQTTEQVFLDALSMLKDDVDGRKELQNLSREDLTMTRSTAHVLQSVLAAALVFVSITPNWRLYFITNQPLFWGIMLAGALGSFYIEAEIRQLEF